VEITRSFPKFLDLSTAIYMVLVTLYIENFMAKESALLLNVLLRSHLKRKSSYGQQVPFLF
jgi:hypothetical protein